MKGPADPDALEIAHLCQVALDARKLSADFGEEPLRKINCILAQYKAPDWKGQSSIGGGLQSTRESTSILGIMYRLWNSWIDDFGHATKRRHHSPRIDSVMESQEESDQLDEDETVFSIETDTCCVVCFGKAREQCPICVSVWYCSE